MSERLFPEASFPALDAGRFDVPTPERLQMPTPSRHRPRFLLLYGSLRERSYSHSERKESAQQLSARVNRRAI